MQVGTSEHNKARCKANSFVLRKITRTTYISKVKIAMPHPALNLEKKNVRQQLLGRIQKSLAL